MSVFSKVSLGYIPVIGGAAPPMASLPPPDPGVTGLEADGLAGADLVVSWAWT